MERGLLQLSPFFIFYTMNSTNRNFKKNVDFYLIFGVIFLIYVLLSINTDLVEFSQHSDINIPSWFFYLTFGTDILVIVSLILILFYRKIGVILFPFFVLTHFALHNYYLSTYLYSDMTTLFLFVGAGLFAIIPRWREMR